MTEKLRKTRVVWGFFMVRIYFILSVLLSGCAIIGNEHSADYQKQTQLILVPGMSMQPEFLKKMALQMLPQFADNVSLARTPSGFYVDLGQNYCIHDFTESVAVIMDNDLAGQAVVFACSQGSASAINSIVKNKNETIKALIIEGILTSGNHAIIRNFEKKMHGVSQIPLSSYVLPYVAKILYPFYSPAGDQALLNIEKLPKDLLVIMLHCKNDPKVSFDEARAFYAGLRKNGNPVYFISKDSPEGHQHDGLFYSDDNEYSKEVATINCILKQHGLPYAENTPDVDLEEYQPEPDFDVYEALVEKEKKVQWFDIGIKSVIGLGVIAYAVYAIIRNKHRS